MFKVESAFKTLFKCFSQNAELLLFLLRWKCEVNDEGAG